MNHGFGDMDFKCSQDLRKRKKKKLGENGFLLHQDMNPTPFEYDAGVLKILPHCVMFGV